MSPINTTSEQSNSSYLAIQNSKYLSKENGSCKSPITRTLFKPLFSDLRNSFIKSFSDFVNLNLYSFSCFIYF